MVAAARVLCLGLVGLWLSRPAARRRRLERRRACATCRRVQRWQRSGLLLGASALLVLSTVAVLVPVLGSGSGSGSGCTTTLARFDDERRGSTVLRDVLTLPATGGALAYARAHTSDLCESPRSGLIMAEADSGYPRAGVTVGRVFMTDPTLFSSGDDVRDMVTHEARHSRQWAVASAVGGPALLPVSYGIVESVLPEGLNPYERAAGLDEGGYEMPDGVGPTPGLPVLLGVGVLLAAARRAARSLPHAALCVIGRSPGGPDHGRASRPTRQDSTR